MQAYRDMTDDEVRRAVKEICRTETTEEGVKERINKELGYTGSIAITSTSSSSGPMTMTMFMVMIYGPSGETIQV